MSANTASLPLSQLAELENSRLGVIYFLGHLRVDFAPEQSAAELNDKVHTFVKNRIGDKTAAAVKTVGDLGVKLAGQVDKIAEVIESWLVKRFPDKIEVEDAKLAVQYVRHNLPSFLFGIGAVPSKAGAYKKVSDATKIPAVGELVDVASGLYQAITKTVEFFELRHAGSGVVMESGHPDMIAASITSAVKKSALEGLLDAAIAGVKAALAALTHGVGEIINQIAGVIECLLRFAVRFCEARTLRKVLAEARSLWSCHRQDDALHTSADEFSDWFQGRIDSSPVVAALVMNCGVAGDAMRFLQVVTGDGSIVTQGQFDKGVTYLNALKSSAGGVLQELREDLGIRTDDQMCEALLKHGEEIGLVHREAASSWRSRLFGLTHQDNRKSRAFKWLLKRGGYKQSTVLRRLQA